MQRTDGAGPLLIVGGSERRDPAGEILERFVDLAGGPDEARIAIVPTASRQPRPLAEEYVAAFTGLGCRDVTIIDARDRAGANDPDVVGHLRDATGIYLTGGDQTRLASVIGGTLLDAELRRAHQRGAVIAGTSAGAAVMSSTMVVGGGDHSVREEDVRLGPGLELLTGVMIDMHFAERGRMQRLLSAVAEYPHQIGVGIDENTGLIVEADRMEVIGEGAVTIIDAGAASSSVPDPGTKALALIDVVLHVLPSGCAFDMEGRRPELRPVDEEAG